jgi:sigma-B regulation protein RsbU (phosphoserine phosphatase)
MRIQSKLFVLLLVIAVLPLIALTWRGQRATESLGLAIVSRGKSSAVDEIELQLGRVVDYSSDVMSAQQQIVELALRLQAAEVERRLAAPPPETAEVYAHSAFEKAETWPPGTALSLDRTAVAGDRKVQALAISTKHQSFFTPREAAPDEDAMRRLASMDAVYMRLNQANPKLFYWQYTAMASGLHSSFPGHGGYPPGYDPRQRAWYQLAATADELIWTPPLWDAATRRLLLTAAMPVKGADGQTAGVTGIDVEILSVLSAIHDKIKLSPNAESFILRLSDDAGGVFMPGRSRGEAGLRVVASSSARGEGARSVDDWDAAVEEPLLGSGTADGRKTIVADLTAGRGGLLRMAHNGADSIWVYRKLERLSAGLVYIVPVGDVEAAADQTQDSVRSATMEQIRLAGFASVGLIVLVALAAMLTSRSITGPLRALAGAARSLAAGDLDARAAVEGRDEVADVARAFNAMVPELRSHIQTKESLSLARDVQQKLLPAAAPSVPGFDVAGRSVYSEDVGGDYYDFLCLTDEAGERRLGVVVGDVTGHGVPAALTMTSVRALIRSHAGDGLAIMPVMRAVNRYLAADSTRGNFVTLVYMVIEPEPRTLRWISAGHGPILFFNADTFGFEELEVHDIPLGVKAEWNYQELSRSTWPSHGVLVVGTDGIWETQNAEGRMFGKENLLGAVKATAHLSADEIATAIVERLAEFRGAAPQTDDVTLVVVKFLARGEA